MLRILALLLVASSAFCANTPQSFLTARFKQHFGFGMEGPIGWLQDTQTNNGCNWDARPQYLSGGVHYVGSTTTLVDPWFFNPAWNNGGHYITGYIDECRTVNTVPWFTWYMLAQSEPANYLPGPAQATPTNAAVAKTMSGYFTLLKKAFQECGSAGNKDYPVVFHFEPDEWCHLLLSTPVIGSWPNQSYDPTAVNIKVGSCGMADVAAFADNLVGYAAAIKYLRDTYAPENVILVCNPSAWDYGNTMTGTRMGQAMLQCCGTWEAAVLETGDRDKGCSTAPPFGDSSGVCGTFDNHIQWITDFKAASALPVFIWQAAVGNTYFRTCNQSDGHYCDNLMQTLLEGYPANNTILRYARAGCLGWVFNAGQGFQTHAYDSKGDGVTNPGAITASLGYASSSSDDDGGYARLRIGAYYAQPYALSSTPNPPIVVDAAFLTAAPTTVSFHAKLGAAPGGNVTVGIARTAGVADVSVATPTLTFTTANWSSYQTVTLNVAPQSGVSGSATVTLSAAGYSPAAVIATERDSTAPAASNGGSSDDSSTKCGLGLGLGAVMPLLWLARRRRQRA